MLRRIGARLSTLFNRRPETIYFDTIDPDTIDLDTLPLRQTRRRVFCGCMIHRELAVLDWRVHELEAVVDAFVVVESTKTHSGKPRRLVRPNEDPRFADLTGRLHCPIITDSPDGDDPWAREKHQRASIWTQGIARLDPADDDLVIISDLDEVPFPEIVERLAMTDFEQPLFIRPHWFNFDWNGYLGPWEHASIRIYTAKYLRTLLGSGHSDEFERGANPGREIRGLNGWHASWFGNEDTVLDKLASYAHAAEQGNRKVAAEGTKGVRRRRRSGRDMFGTRPVFANRPRMPVHADRALGNSKDAPIPV